jgi:hypothetical protein
MEQGFHFDRTNSRRTAPLEESRPQATTLEDSRVLLFVVRHLYSIFGARSESAGICRTSDPVKRHHIGYYVGDSDQARQSTEFWGNGTVLHD